MEGWIKLHRKFDDWQWINKPEMVSIFIHCLVRANHNGNYWLDTEIKRGQFITSPEKISAKLGISYQTVRTCLNRLEKTGEINKQTTNKYTIITVCNYDDYQLEQQTTNKRTNKQLTNNQQTTNKQLTTNKNNKECKEYIYDSFYDFEIEKSNNDENYINFIKVLFGSNTLSKKLERVLSMQEQVTFEQFKTIFNFKEKYKVIIGDYLVRMENWKDLTKKNTSVQLTLLDWIRRDNK